MKQKLFLAILITLLIVSYSTKTQKSIDDITDNFSFSSTISRSSQIVIKCYDSLVTNKTVEVESFQPSQKIEITNQQQIDDFDKIFINAEKTNYCCCPKSSYSIHFFNQREEIDFFYIDTLEFKNKLRICEKSFQYSYIIEKQKWNNYLLTITK